jgi:hypothetical protein
MSLGLPLPPCATKAFGDPALYVQASLLHPASPHPLGSRAGRPATHVATAAAAGGPGPARVGTGASEEVSATAEEATDGKHDGKHATTGAAVGAPVPVMLTMVPTLGADFPRPPTWTSA